MITTNDVFTHQLTMALIWHNWRYLLLLLTVNYPIFGNLFNESKLEQFLIDSHDKNMEHLTEYFNVASIHGLRYITNSRKLNRLLWLMIVLSSLIGSFVLIHESFDSWAKSPIKTTVKSEPIQNFNMSGCLNIFLRSIDIFVEKLEMARKGSLLKPRKNCFWDSN